jgi:hypothetical protein
MGIAEWWVFGSASGQRICDQRAGSGFSRVLVEEAVCINRGGKRGKGRKGKQRNEFRFTTGGSWSAGFGISSFGVSHLSTCRRRLAKRRRSLSVYCTCVYYRKGPAVSSPVFVPRE